MFPVAVHGWVGREGDVRARGWYCSITRSDCLVAQSHTAAVYLIAMSAFIIPRIVDSQNIIDIGHGLTVSARDTQIVPTTLTVQKSYLQPLGSPMPMSTYMQVKGDVRDSKAGRAD